MAADEQREPAPSGETNGTGSNNIDNGIVRSDAPMQEALEPKLDDAVAFLHWFRPAGPWVLTAIHNDRKNYDTVTETFQRGDEDRMRAWIEHHNLVRGFNLYHHVNGVLRPLTKKAEKTDMASMDWIHVDIDPMPGKPIDAERARILGMLGEHDHLPAPTATVYSGGGYWGLWRLKNPLPIDGDLTKAEDAERYNRQVELLMGADACHNCDRIMRLPGTINWPNDKKKAKGQVPVLACVVEHHDDRIYPLSAFTKAEPKPDSVPTSATEVKVSGTRRHVELDDLPKELNDRIKVIIQQGRDDDQPLAGKDQSRSAWLLYAVGSMVRCKDIDDDTIYAIITAPKYKISASVLDKGSRAQVDRYALRQIKRAKEDAIAPELAELNDTYAVIKSIGGKCRVMQYERVGRRDVPRFSEFQDFKNAYCNRYVQVLVGKDAKGQEQSKPVPLGKWWLEHPERRDYEGVVFDPTTAEEVVFTKNKADKGRLNLWRGFAVEPKAGDWSLMQAHIRFVAGDHAEYLLNWMAWTVQNPHRPAEVAIVFRGKEGTGKGAIAREFGRLFGNHFQHISDPEDFVGKFNAPLMNCVFLFADEAFAPDSRRAVGKMKALLTEEEIQIELKGVDKVSWPNRLHVMVASNEGFVVPASLSDRRFVVFDVPDEHMQDGAYFDALFAQMDNGGREAMLHDLLSRPLGDWHPRKDRPKTAALNEQKAMALRGVERLWFEALCSGELPAGVPMSEGRVALPSGALLAAWEKRLGKSPEGATNELAALMHKPQGNHRGQGMEFEKKTNAPRGYVLPKLAECRRLWAERRFPVEWEDSDAEWSLAQRPF